jgi:hypothetical protein
VLVAGLSSFDGSKSRTDLRQTGSEGLRQIHTERQAAAKEDIQL